MALLSLKRLSPADSVIYIADQTHEDHQKVRKIFLETLRMGILKIKGYAAKGPLPLSAEDFAGVSPQYWLSINFNSFVEILNDETQIPEQWREESDRILSRHVAVLNPFIEKKDIDDWLQIHAKKNKDKKNQKSLGARNAYLLRIKEHEKSGIIPSRAEDDEWAKSQGLSTTAIRALRKELAPKLWTAQGRRPIVKN